jgi:hypothetical protein
MPRSQISCKALAPKVEKKKDGSVKDEQLGKPDASSETLMDMMLGSTPSPDTKSVGSGERLSAGFNTILL